jgi:hypothetical protein
MTTRPTLSPAPAEPLADQGGGGWDVSDNPKDPDTIWLRPPDIFGNRDWSDWDDFDDGLKYVRGDIHDAALARIKELESALKSSADGDVIAWPSDDPESGGIGLDDLVVQMLEESGEHELVAQFDLAARLPSVWVNASLGEDGVLHLTRHDTEDAALKGPST